MITNRKHKKTVSFILFLLLAAGIVAGTYLVQNNQDIREKASAQNLKFAVIGDFGVDDANQLAVANLVKSWSPELIITTGDNNYDDGAASTIDQNIGKYYHEFIGSYKGTYGSGSVTNRFYPSLGNHDWHASNAQPYLDYFELPNNERYYDFILGPVHFYAIDSDSHEPDGNTATSTQAMWLKNKLASSTSTWNVVYFHHAAYSSSSNHGSYLKMRWPFKEWGADVVMSGHDHTYERLNIGGLTYFVNGVGGSSLYGFGTPISGSEFRYNAMHGAMLVEADAQSMSFKFYNKSNVLIDSHTIISGPQPTGTSYPSWDVDRNGVVNIVDIGLVVDNYGKNLSSNPRADVNGDGTINIVDIGIVVDYYQ